MFLATARAARAPRPSLFKLGATVRAFLRVHRHIGLAGWALGGLGCPNREAALRAFGDTLGQRRLARRACSLQLLRGVAIRGCVFGSAL